MKTKAIFLIIILSHFSKTIRAEETPQNNLSFRIGEKCEYSLFYNWGFIWINAAKVVFTVTDATYHKTSVYKLKMTSETVKSFSVINLKDTATTYIDKKTLLPYFTRQASFEPDYYSIDKFTFFNQNDDEPWKVIIEKERKKGISKDTIISDKVYYDLLSTLYRLRNMDIGTLAVNQKIPMLMVFNDGTYDLYLRYVGKDQIKLKNGKIYNCLKMKPLLAEGKMFEKGEGMTIWISDDKNHIPMMVESKLKIGSVKAMLNGIENNMHPMVSEVKLKK